MEISTRERGSRAIRSQRTHDLLLEAHASEDAEERRRLLDEVVLINRGVAEAVAARYRGRGIDELDLRQAAFEGLIKAVHKFDPSVRPDLLTYAVPTIRGQVMRYFRDHGWMVRPPRRIQELQWKVTRSIESLSGTLGRAPTYAEVGADVDCLPEEVGEAVSAFGAFSPVSLDQPRGTQEHPILDSLSVEDSSFDAAEARAIVGPALDCLTDRERRIVQLSYVEGKTQSEIGEVFGITQMQVSRLLAKILDRLRKQLDV